MLEDSLADDLQEVVLAPSAATSDNRPRFRHRDRVAEESGEVAGKARGEPEILRQGHEERG